MSLITNKRSPICIDGFREFIRNDPLIFNRIDIRQCEECRSWRNNCDGFFWDYGPTGTSFYNHSELIDCLCSAFDKVARYTNIYPTVQWTCDEVIQIQDNWFTHRKPGINLEDMVFQTHWKMVKDFGARNREFLDTAEIIYTDEDDDGFAETATIEYNIPEQYIGACDLVLMYPGTDYEICPINIDFYDKDSGDIRFKIDAWNLVKPELYGSGKASYKEVLAINPCDLNSFIPEVDIWIDGIDQCKASGVVVFEDRGHCNPKCETIEVPFCVQIVDPCMGYFKIRLQSYDEDTGCVVDKPFCPNTCMVPINLKINYRSGCGHNCLKNCGAFCECNILHEAVYSLAACCLPIHSCECSCVVEKIQVLQSEVYMISKESPRWNLPASVRNDTRTLAFGSMLGEVKTAVALNTFLEDFCISD